jgi:DNA-binding XRE family transcriptional regulator
VDIDWPADFGRWLDRLEHEARSGDQRSRTILTFTARAPDQLRSLASPPGQDAETATLRKVRQSRRHQLWRVSPAYHPEVAVRLSCWFPPESGTVVVAVFAAEKAKLGDVFYDSVAARADPMIDQWETRDRLRGEAMTENNASSQQRVFVRGNEHLDRLMSDPQLAADVARAHADSEEMDRVYAMNLAMIRKAAHMTQVEVARKLGVGQGAISRLENRTDMLLSTLYDYLTATGAEAASIVVTVRSHKIELDLSRLHDPDPGQSAA